MVEIINNVFTRRKYIVLVPTPEPFPVNIGKRRQTTDTSRKSIYSSNSNTKHFIEKRLMTTSRF